MREAGFETLTVAASAVSPGAAASPAAGETQNALFGPLEAGQVRWRGDGTAPTASVGHILEIGDILVYDGDVTSIQFIRTGGTSGTLPASYYLRG